MSDWTPQDLENIQDMLDAADVGYWATARHDGQVVVIRERDGDALAQISPATVLDWLATDQPLALIRALGDPYQRAAIASLMARDWDGVDWDAETGDLILQWMIFGEIIYG